MRRLIVAALLLLATAACGYDAPQSPTPPPPTPTTPSPTPPPVTSPSALSVTLLGGSGMTGRPVMFTATVYGGATPPFVYTVAFGDGATATIASPDRAVDVQHVYGRAGTYTQRLVVTDAAERSGENAGESIITNPAPPPEPTPPTPPPPPTYLVSVVAAPNPVVAGQAVILTATAAPANGAPPATAFDWDCLGDGSLDVTDFGSAYTCLYPTAGTKTATVVARSVTVTASGTATVTVLADAPLHVEITADDLSPDNGQTVTFTATVTSAGNIPTALRWYWDWANDGYDLVVPGGNPNMQTHRFGASGVTTIKVRVVDEASGRDAISTLDFTVNRR